MLLSIFETIQYQNLFLNRITSKTAQTLMYDYDFKSCYTGEFFMVKTCSIIQLPSDREAQVCPLYVAELQSLCTLAHGSVHTSVPLYYPAYLLE